jgi:hypothetical protein
MSDPEDLGPDSKTELSPASEAALSRALSAAWSPAELASERHERLLSAALEDPFAPPSEAEVEAAEALRLALEGDRGSGDAALARALAHAVVPSEAEPRRAERSLEHALTAPKSRPNVVFVTFGVLAATLSLAAAFALVALPVRESPPFNRPSPALSRSLGPTLGADAQNLSATARMDRIASVRARDLRENRYLAWGVR